MPKWSYIICLAFSPLLLLSQEVSSKGRFSVAAGRGCAPFTVNITKLDTFGTVTRTYFYFEGASSSSDTTFTYQDVGTYEIVQIVGVDDLDDKTDTLQVEVMASLRPEIEITRCSNQEVAVQSIDSYYDSVRVYFSSTDSVTLMLSESASFAYSSNAPQLISTRGLFTNASNVCQTYLEEIVPLTALSTPEIVSASIKESCQGSYTLYLALDEFQSQVNYRILLDQTSTSTLFDGFLDTSRLVLGNIPFEVTDFCLRVETYDPCNDISNQSSSFCGTPSALSLSPFESLYSSYNGSGIFINLDSVSSGAFSIQRRFDGRDFEDRTSVSGSFTDPIGSTSRKYYYRINYIDSCGTVLYEAETHPPHIESKTISENVYQITFEPAENSLATSFTNSYSIGNTTERFSSEEFEIRLASENGVPNQFFYAESEYGSGEVIRSNTLQLRYKLIIYVPKAFTPNGDGLNDTLQFFGLPTSNTELKIYSKWGQLIYNSTDAESGWDGSSGGSRAPEGTYLYEIVFETTEGKMLRQKGTFALINK